MKNHGTRPSSLLRFGLALSALLGAAGASACSANQIETILPIVSVVTMTVAGVVASLMIGNRRGVAGPLLPLAILVWPVGLLYACLARPNRDSDDLLGGVRSGRRGGGGASRC